MQGHGCFHKLVLVVGVLLNEIYYLGSILGPVFIGTPIHLNSRVSKALGRQSLKGLPQKPETRPSVALAPGSWASESARFNLDRGETRKRHL